MGKCGGKGQWIKMATALLAVKGRIEQVQFLLHCSRHEKYHYLISTSNCPVAFQAAKQIPCLWKQRRQICSLPLDYGAW